MKRPLTDHEYNINNAAWIACDNTNTIDNGNGTYTIVDDSLNANIPIGGLAVRVKALGGNSPGASLYNTVAFVAHSDIDSDAQAYLTAANILPGQTFSGDPSIDPPLPSEKVIAGVNKLFISLKSSGLYAKIKVMYPFLGATQSANLINAVSPSVKNAIAVSPFTASFERYGLKFDSSSMLNSQALLTNFADFNITAGIYYTSSGGGYHFGTASNSDSLFVYGASSSGYFPRREDYNSISLPSYAGGLTLFNMLASNVKSVYRRGIKVVTNTEQSNTSHLASEYFPIWLGNINYTNAYNNGGAASYRAGMFFLSEGLTDSESVTMTNIVEQWAFDCKRDKGDQTFETYQFFGDSITFGQFANPDWKSWVNSLTFSKDVQPKNYGVPGTTIADCNNTQINSLIPKDGKHTKVFVAFSTNDFFNQIQGYGGSVSAFQNTYGEVLDKILAAGYLPDDIVTIPTYLISQENYNNYPGVYELQDQYAAAVATACADRGITHVYNMKPVLQNAGGDTLISGIHPNSAGHQVIDNYLLSVI